jgi:hypothetical protein
VIDIDPGDPSALRIASQKKKITRAAAARGGKDHFHSNGSQTKAKKAKGRCRLGKDRFNSAAAADGIYDDDSETENAFREAEICRD